MQKRNEIDVEKTRPATAEDLHRQDGSESVTEEPRILDDICVEELAIDGICGVY